MKTMKWALLFVLTNVIFLWSFKKMDEQKGIIQPVDGIFVYHYCQPAAQFETLGVLEVKFITNNSPRLLLHQLMRRAEKNYPGYTGLILNEEMDKAKVIKHKTQ